MNVAETNALDDRMAATPPVLFVDHSSKLAGAELCLLDIVRGFPSGSSVFLFEDGPLHGALLARGVEVAISRRTTSFAGIKKDRSLAHSLPHAGGIAAMTAEIAMHARRHKLVYANSQKAFVLGAAAAFIARRPLVWHLHDILSPAHFGAAQRRLTVALANRLTSCVIVPSEAAAIAFTDAGGKGSLVHVVPNGLDIAPDTAGTAELRASLGLPDGFLFGVFSRLSPWKGQQVAIEALARVPGSHCIIVGAALFGEDGYANSLRDSAARLGVSNRVTFMGHRNDVPRLMRAVDAMVHPSLDPEPFGRTLVEAMLCRVPVIAARNGAIPEILDDGRAGFLVTPGDAEELASLLHSLMTGEVVTKPTVERAEQRARQLYNASRMVADIHHVIAPWLQVAA